MLRITFSMENTKEVKLSWIDVWTLLITRPTVEAYSYLLEDRNAKPSRGILWVYLTGSLLFIVLFFTIVNNPEFAVLMQEQAGEAGLTASMEELRGSMLFVFICMTPFVALFAVLGVALQSWLTHFLAGILSDEKTKPNVTNKANMLFYGFAAIQSPVAILNAFLFLLPIGLSTILGVVLSVLSLFMLVVMTQAVYKMNRRTAALVVFIPWLLFFFINLVLL
jgi:hypothetical protein